jgi:hypothetical protein
MSSATSRLSEVQQGTLPLEGLMAVDILNCELCLNQSISDIQMITERSKDTSVYNLI